MAISEKNTAVFYDLSSFEPTYFFLNKKHLKNVGPIRHCEPPHTDVHNNNNDDDHNDNA